MNNKKEDIYELNFGQLIEEKTGVIEENQNVFNAKVNVSVSIGNTSETIKKILNLKEGSIIKLNKNVDEKLDIYANDRLFAYGESIITNEKLSIRLSKIEDSDIN
ncbi:flagellar motor switch protein FliN [Clostridioides difficile]|nr:flagellar motor switch protein FliN [Clostridioides difficile]